MAVYQRTSSDVDPEYVARKRAEFEALHPKREYPPLKHPPNYDAEYFKAMDIMDHDEDY